MGVFTCLNLYTASSLPYTPTPALWSLGEWDELKQEGTLKCYGSFTIAFIHRDLLAPLLSDALRDLLLPQLRLHFTHCSYSLGLTTWLLPHGTRNGLHWDSWMIARKELTLRIAIFQVPITCSKPNYPSWEWETGLIEHESKDVDGSHN